MRRTAVSRLIVLLIVLVLPSLVFGMEPLRMKHALSLYADKDGNALNQPEGVACSEDQLVIADTGNGRLVLNSLQGGDPKGGTEIKIPQVLYPVRVAISSKGDIYVLDKRQRKVVILTREGAFKGYVETTGLPTEGMVVPAGIALDADNRLYLLDVLGGKVLVFSADGKFERQINPPQGYGFFTDVAVDPKGTIFLVDGVNSMVYSNAKDPAVFAPISVTFKDELKFPSNITADDKGMLFISDQNSGGVAVVGQDGVFRNRLLSLGWKEGAVRYPAQTCVDKAGDLFVADRANSRIQKFTPLQ